MGATTGPTGDRRRRYWGTRAPLAAALLAAALLAVALLAGCGGEESSAAGKPEEARDSPQGQDPTPQAQGSGREAAQGNTGGPQEETRLEEGSGGGAEKPEAVKGLYLPGFEAKGRKLDKVLQIADETEINALVVDVKEAGSTTYPSDVPLAKEIGATSDAIPDLEALVDQLHERDLYAIARLAVFQDDVLPYERPDLAVMDSVTGTQWQTYQGAAWANPYRREVQEYNVEIAKEAARAGFDEVQFDYVRFPSDGPMARLEYGEATAPTQEDTIAGFLEYAHGELEPLGVEVSADVFGLVGVNDYVGVGQVVSKMAPHLDVLCPMVYPSHYPPGAYGYGNPDAFPYEIVDLAMADFKTKSRRVNPDIEIRPWLQDFDYISAYEPADVKAQMRATHDSGLEGWLLWNAAAEYTTEILKTTSR